LKTTIKRCDWCNSDPLYQEYHDNEWGKPVYDDQKLFENLILEGAQAGLSWITVLRKRHEYRKVYANFDPKIVAKFTDKKQAALLLNPGIIRNKLKIKASISNAQAFLAIQKEFGSFSEYQWRFVDGSPIKHRFKKSSEVPATTPVSDLFSKDLKQRGFKFVGSTIIYAHMQACGMVNDHLTTCFCYSNE